MRITEAQVIEAYTEYLRLKVRRMEIENTRVETPAEFEERKEAEYQHNTLELQYEAQFVA